MFPTYVIRPAIPATGLSSQVLNWLYANDYMYNAFPSGHVYLTTLIALFWSSWFPKWRWFLAATVGMVILATLFTHQHYLPALSVDWRLPGSDIGLGYGEWRTGTQSVRGWTVQRLDDH